MRHALRSPRPLAKAASIAKNRRIRIDARNYKQWIYFNFEQGIVHPRYVSSMNWDLAFKRYHIIANGGSANLVARGGIADLGNVNPEKVEKPSSARYVLDTKTQNGLDSENAAIRHWYNYDYASHVLSPRPHLYAVRTPDNRLYLFRILDYYCPNSEAGCLMFEYRRLQGFVPGGEKYAA